MSRLRSPWRSAGLHLVERDASGHLRVTADYLRAYLTRPELHPVEESCAAEHHVFERLMADPFVPVDASRIAAIADEDARANWRVMLGFRDHLAAHGTVEAAYAALFRSPIRIPPMFVDQMVHLVLANVLHDETDPLRWRAGELLFREQVASVGPDRLLLADAEIVEMRSGGAGAAHGQSHDAGLGALGELLVQSGTPAREVSLDVLGPDGDVDYFARADRYDTAVDFRFTQAAPDAFGAVLRMWVRHFHGVETRVEAVRSIRDERWSWHVGLTREATRLLNALWDGEELSEEEAGRIVALYRMEIADQDAVVENVRGKPVWLALAMEPADGGGRVVVKPQNLVTGMPLAAN